jgi:hypothetical protein
MDLSRPGNHAVLISPHALVHAGRWVYQGCVLQVCLHCSHPCVPMLQAVISASCIACRKTKGKWQKAYAWSQVGVGLVAATYHASTGRHRPAFRRADFWTIAFGSATMTRARALLTLRVQPCWSLPRLVHLIGQWGK